MEPSKKVNRAVSRKTSSQPDNTLPADSLSEIMLGFYKTMNPISKKLTNKKPNAIWIAMSPPSQEKDSALDNLGTDLKETFKDINVLNDNQPIIYDENLQKGLETVIRKLLKKNPSYEPNINLFLTAHGAPSWFFGPIKNYHFLGCGLGYITKPLDNDIKNLLMNNLTQSCFIFSHHHLYFFNRETNVFFDASTPASNDNTSLHQNISYFNEIKKLISEQSFQNITQKNMMIKSLSYSIYKKINQFFNQPLDYLESKFDLDSFVKDECKNAAELANIFMNIETNCNFKINSVVLFSCNSSSEFINHESLETSLSPARVLSALFKDRFIIGGAGKNANGKTTSLFQKNDKNFVSVTPKLEKTLTVYMNQNVYYHPKDEFYVQNKDYLDYCYLNFFTKDKEGFTKCSSALEELTDNKIMLDTKTLLEGDFGIASLQLKTMNIFSKELTNTNAPRNRALVV